MRGKVSMPLPVMLPAGLSSKVQGVLGRSELATSADTGRLLGGEPPAPDTHLLHQLRHWRREKAQQADCPTYRIVPSSVLEQLASSPCLTAEDLLGVRGIGPATIVRYGDELLELLKAFWGGISLDPSPQLHSVAFPPAEGDSASSPVPEGGVLRGMASGQEEEQRGDAVPAPTVPENVAELETLQDGVSTSDAGTAKVGNEISQRNYYWTWRVLAAGFRPRECAAIRRCLLDDVYREIVSAYHHGLDMEPSWLFTSDELTELQELRNLSGTGGKEDGPRGAFSAAQWLAFQTCCVE